MNTLSQEISKPHQKIKFGWQQKQAMIELHEMAEFYKLVCLLIIWYRG